MSSINFQRTYYLGEAYSEVEKRVSQKLAKYSYYAQLVTFHAAERSVKFTTERIIPSGERNRPRVMLLFSNPHPHSVYQGMFLSPNTRGQESLLWSVMKASGWLSTPIEKESIEQRAERFTQAEYESPFDLLFYCYYAFPTDYPSDLKKIFGSMYFSKILETEAVNEFKQTRQQDKVEAVVTFNKGIFNHVAQHPVRTYIKRLNAGELIQSQLIDAKKGIPIFLTYPTGWRYHQDYMELRVKNLDKIKISIIETIAKNT